MTASRRSINSSTQRRGQKHLVEVESRNANVQSLEFDPKSLPYALTHPQYKAETQVSFET